MVVAVDRTPGKDDPGGRWSGTLLVLILVLFRPWRVTVVIIGVVWVISVCLLLPGRVDRPSGKKSTCSAAADRSGPVEVLWPVPRRSYPVRRATCSTGSPPGTGHLPDQRRSVSSLRAAGDKPYNRGSPPAPDGRSAPRAGHPVDDDDVFVAAGDRQVCSPFAGPCRSRRFPLSLSKGRDQRSLGTGPPTLALPFVVGCPCLVAPVAAPSAPVLGLTAAQVQERVLDGRTKARFSIHSREDLQISGHLLTSTSPTGPPT